MILRDDIKIAFCEALKLAVPVGSTARFCKDSNKSPSSAELMFLSIIISTLTSDMHTLLVG